MEAVLQARRRDTGATRAGRLSAWSAGVVADLACRLFDRRALDHRAVAMDADRHQAYQRCAVGCRSRPGRSANTFAHPEMGRCSRRANGFGGPRNRSLSVGMPAKLVPTFRSSCYVAAPTLTNFGKSWALENILILVPLFYLKFLDRIRRLWCGNGGTSGS